MTSTTTSAVGCRRVWCAGLANLGRNGCAVPGWAGHHDGHERPAVALPRIRAALNPSAAAGCS
jgi:hypothetical protein